MYLLFVLFVNIFWWVRVYIGHKNKTYEEAFNGTLSVLIAVLHEDLKLFESCLKSIVKYGHPTELVISIDDFPHADAELIRIARKYATNVIEQPRLVGKREQYHNAVHILKQDVDVVVTVDSDTIWDDSTLNMLKPFNDEKVGAVSGTQVIFNENGNYIRRIAQWFEDLRFSVTLPFQSYYGQVNVIPGRTLAARTELYKQISHRVRSEVFLSRRIITSDDASVTMDILKLGYKVVYQKDSFVTTDAPNNLKGLIKQYLRWYRGAYRRFFTRFPQIMKMSPLVILSNIEFLFGTFVYAGIIFTFALKIVFNVYAFDGTTGFEFTQQFSPGFIVLLLLGYFGTVLVRNIPHFIHKPSDILFLPVYALFSLIIITPLKVVAMFTMFENGWMTRRSGTRHEEIGLLKTRSFGAGMALVIVLLTVPIAYLVDVQPTHVPLTTILANDGLAYSRARDIIVFSKKQSSVQTVASIHHVYEIEHGKTPQNDAAAACVAGKLESDSQNISTSEPLAVFDDCYAAVFKTVGSRGKAASTPTTQVKQVPRNDLQPVIILAIEGDSQYRIAALYVEANGSELNGSEKAFAVNRLVSRMGDDNSIAVGQTVSFSPSDFTAIKDAAKILDPSQQKAWSVYIQ